MAQIIKHRRGTLAQLNNVTLNNGEIGIVSSSVSNIGDSELKSSLVIGHTDGTNRLTISRLIRGNATPNLGGITGGSNFNDMLYFETDTKTLSALHTGGNINLDLTGNIANRAIGGTIDATNFGSTLKEKVSGSFTAASASLASRITTEETTPDYTAAQISGSWQGNNIIDISSDTNLVAGTGITLSGDTLNVDASQAAITSVGTLTGLTVSSEGSDRISISGTGQLMDGMTIGSNTAAAGTFTDITSTGDITAQGNIYAQKYIVSSSVTHFTQSFSSGSTKFGDTADDIHSFTGSLNVEGAISGSFTGSVLITDGAIGSDGQPVTIYANAGEIDNTVIGGEASAVGTFSTLNVENGFLPDANDGAFIGAAGTAFSDLFLAEGGVINWDSGDVTITQAGSSLTIAGANTTQIDGIISASRIITTGNSTLGNSSSDSHTINGIIKGFAKVSGSISSTGSFGRIDTPILSATTIAGTIGTATQNSITSATNLTSVGTIGTGIWQGTAVADTYVANDLTISGGTVNNSVIGGSTAAAGTFTAIVGTGLTVNGNATIGNSGDPGIHTIHGQIKGDNLTKVSGSATSTGSFGRVEAGGVSLDNNTVSATTVAGTLSTAAQPNITSIGTLAAIDITIGTDTYISVGPTQQIIDGMVIGGTTAAAGTFTTLASTGNTTIGNASGDSLTINAATIDVPNMGTGTDNSVVVRASGVGNDLLVTDEIDPRVWGSTLVDGSGGANQIAYWSDSNTVTSTNAISFDGNNLSLDAGVIATGNISGSAASTGSFGHLIFSTGTIDGGGF